MLDVNIFMSPLLLFVKAHVSHDVSVETSTLERFSSNWRFREKTRIKLTLLIYMSFVCFISP